MKLKIFCMSFLSLISMGLAHAQIEAGHVQDSVSAMVRHASGGVGVGVSDGIHSTESVPEFGLVAALILSIAIISIIVVSAKNGFKYKF